MYKGVNSFKILYSSPRGNYFCNNRLQLEACANLRVAQGGKKELSLFHQYFKTNE